MERLIAEVEAAESVRLAEPIRMYLREIAEVPPLAQFDEDEAVLGMRHGQMDAETRLTEANLWEVVRIARPFIGRGRPFLDLVQDGNIGLVRAVHETASSDQPFGSIRDLRIREAIEQAFTE